MRARLLDLSQEAVRAARLGDRAGLLDQLERVVAAVLPGRDVGQPDQVRGHTGPRARFPPQPRRLLQMQPRRLEPAGGVLRDTQVPQRLGHGCGVVGLRGQLQRPPEHGDRGLVVAPDHLVAAAHPEQRLGFPADVAARPVQLRGPLEGGQLTRILAACSGSSARCWRNRPWMTRPRPRARSASTPSSSNSAASSAPASPSNSARSYSNLDRSIRSSILGTPPRSQVRPGPP